MIAHWSLTSAFLDSDMRKASLKNHFSTVGSGHALCSILSGVFQFSSVTQSCPTLCDSMDCSTPGLPVHHQLPEFTQTHVRWVVDAIQPSHPLLSPSPQPSIFPSIRLFSSESVLCIRWPKYWSFSFKISPFNEHSGLISFRMYWWVYGKLFMAKNRHLVLLALKIPDPNSLGHLIWNMLQGLWWAGLESIQQGSFKEHLGSACPDGRRALQHSFAGLDSSVSGRCQPCMAVCTQGGRPLSFIGQKWFALRFASQFVLPRVGLGHTVSNSLSRWVLAKVFWRGL